MKQIVKKVLSVFLIVTILMGLSLTVSAAPYMPSSYFTKLVIKPMNSSGQFVASDVLTVTKFVDGSSPTGYYITPVSLPERFWSTAYTDITQIQVEITVEVCEANKYASGSPGVVYTAITPYTQKVFTYKFSKSSWPSNNFYSYDFRTVDASGAMSNGKAIAIDLRS